MRKIIEKSRTKKRNHITIVAEIEKGYEEKAQKETKKALRKLRRLFEKEMSYELVMIVDLDSNFLGE